MRDSITEPLAVLVRHLWLALFASFRTIEHLAKLGG